MIRCILLTLILTWPVAARAADDKDFLKGNWTVIKAEENGKASPEFHKATLTFILTPKDGDKLVVKLPDETQTHEVAIKLDASKTPKQIDLTHTDSGQTKTALGIYELAGDMLKLCIIEPNAGARPTEFKSTNRKVTYLELKRDAKH